MSRAAIIVEDEPTFLRVLSRYLASRGWNVVSASSIAEGMRALDTTENLGFVLTDLRLPDGTGFELAQRGADRKPSVPVILMTGEGSIDAAISAIHRRVSDFLLKPFSFDALDEAIDRAMRPPLATTVQATVAATPMEQWRAAHAPGLVGKSESLMRAFAIVERIADTDCTVLVTGESGTGKELVARATHSASDRSRGPFVTVNCAALPENLIESELFGHSRGAFTGAVSSSEGRFRAADGGTLFLDEIGELPLTLQSKLLRVLQEKEVTPVGEAKAYKVDVRVVAATNRDLEDMVRSGVFREDLLYRLSVIPIELPPLRERRDDIPELVHFFIDRANKRRGRRISGIDADALAFLKATDWPGNIRQLENLVERMVVLRSEGPLTVDDLPSKLRRANSSVPEHSPFAVPLLPEDGVDLRDAVEKFENALIVQALERTGWNKNRAAAMLRLNRTTLVEKLKKKGLDRGGEAES